MPKLAPPARAGEGIARCKVFWPSISKWELRYEAKNVFSTSQGAKEAQGRKAQVLVHISRNRLRGSYGAVPSSEAFAN